jgi:hypothetical protein
VNAPSADDIKGWTELDTFTGAPAPRQERLTAIAISMFKRITGVTDFAAVAADDEPLAQQAITGLAELLTYQTSPEYMDTLSDWDLISSFSAGPYSETHRNPEEARKARLLVAWPWLSDLLWGLLTPERYDYWVSFFGGQNAPAFAVTEVDWSAGQDLLGGSYQADDPGFFGA